MIRIKVRDLGLVLWLGLAISIRTSWVVNFALFRSYRPVIYTRPSNSKPSTP